MEKDTRKKVMFFPFLEFTSGDALCFSCTKGEMILDTAYRIPCFGCEVIGSALIQFYHLQIRFVGGERVN